MLKHWKGVFEVIPPGSEATSTSMKRQCLGSKCSMCTRGLHSWCWKSLFPYHPVPGIFTYIYHRNQPNVGKYTIRGWYGIHVLLWKRWRVLLLILIDPMEVGNVGITANQQWIPGKLPKAKVASCRSRRLDLHHTGSKWRNSQKVDWKGAMIDQYMGVASHLLSRWYTYRPLFITGKILPTVQF